LLYKELVGSKSEVLPLQSIQLKSSFYFRAQRIK